MPSLSNRDRVGKAFELLADGLEPFINVHMSRTSPHGDDWPAHFAKSAKPKPIQDWSLSDPAFQLRVIHECWQAAFRSQIREIRRGLVDQLRGDRNEWAHNKSFSADEAYSILDRIETLLDAIDANEVDAVRESKVELGRKMYERTEAKRAEGDTSVVASTPKGLTPWREVVTPHSDVTEEARFNLAEFAADLHLVQLGVGRAEYTDPVEFFQRTYLTDGLRVLLQDALNRVVGTGGPPVLNLQTNFGGGKTHSLIALYHLFSGVKASKLPEDIRGLLEGVELDESPKIPRAVLVGTKLSPAQVDVKDDGTEVRTLWGELAWQLGGSEAYAMIADSDRAATNPGDLFRQVLKKYSPCLILIDEWVAYARELLEKPDLPAGSFDTQFSFAQSLAEAATGTDGVLFVVSIPASEGASDDQAEPIGSEVEVGGAAGREALKRLTNVISRHAEHWKSATREESFEIVRRRLFQPLDDAGTESANATAEGFADLYRTQRSEFPTECAEVAYQERIKKAYPVHPELFDRLYADWSTVERFQQTRGVLRLVASVVYSLWQSGDQSPLIMPSSVPLSDGPVNVELTRNLEDNWKPVIDADIDGPDARAAQIDRNYQNLGRYHATRRVARTVFLGSAPTAKSANRGIEIERIRLGSCLPGDSIPVFGDALSRLSDVAPHLYVDRSRYWFDTQENVNRTAREEADRLLNKHRDEVHAEIERRLHAQKEKGGFAAVHVAPKTSDSVADEAAARLVVLPALQPHMAKTDESPARAAAQEVLERRGDTPRQYRNMLVFAAADQKQLEHLERTCADFLAWTMIDEQAEERNLDAYQAKQAAAKRSESDDAANLRLAEAYQWLLVPSQPDPQGPIEFEAGKLDTQGSIGQRASRKLDNEGALLTQFPPVLLRLQLDTTLASLWEEGDVRVADVWECFAKYVYLPRLRDQEVLISAVEDGPGQTTWQSEGFAVAHGADEKSGRYLGLTVGSHPGQVGMTSLLVKPEFALGQLEEEEGEPAATGTGTSTVQPGERADAGDDEEPARRKPVRFQGAMELDPMRPNKDFGTVVQEVLEHLTRLVGADVDLTLEVEARLGDGFDDDVVRIVTENIRTLGFREGSGFEDS